MSRVLFLLMLSAAVGWGVSSLTYGTTTSQTIQGGGAAGAGTTADPTACPPGYSYLAFARDMDAARSAATHGRVALAAHWMTKMSSCLRATAEDVDREMRK